MGIEVFAQGRVFGNGRGIDLATLRPIYAPECPIDILTAGYHGATSEACKDLNKLLGLLLRGLYHVQDDIWLPRAQRAGIICQLVAIAQNLLDALWQGGAGLATMEKRDLVPGRVQIFENIRPHKTSSADHQDTHVWLL